MHQSKVCRIHQSPIQGDILILVREVKKTLCQRSRFTQDSPQGRERYSFKPENMLLYYLIAVCGPLPKTSGTAARMVGAPLAATWMIVSWASTWEPTTTWSSPSARVNC